LPACDIQLGEVTQSASAFLRVHDSLAFFRAVYDSFASDPAAIIRVGGGPGVRTALPDCIVGVSHRETVDQHHDQRVKLLGGGQWRLWALGEALA
jgi:ABC-type uncharacterized transport system fused permease/ATPase subunit